MKKTLILVIVLCVFFFSSCDVNAPLRTKMLDYYSDTEVYSVLYGKIVSVLVDEEARQMIVEIDILTQGHSFPLNPQTGLCQFAIVNFTEEDATICVGDDIEFTSAPMYFYNGHYLPLLSLKKGDTEIMTLEEGKERYMSWIKQTFD